MNTGHDGFSRSAGRLEEVAHLVREEQEDDAERELPAPDQRVAAERDEERRELGERAELRRKPEQDDDAAPPTRRRGPRQSGPRGPIGS